uniref:Thiolase N-terminal domain-containing protein n=1 Tax=Amphimedon queenslandica TaxID=400682 RepID=A0A1X7SJ90_AMPQE
MESKVDNEITELLRYYAEDVHGMKLSESQVKVTISSEISESQVEVIINEMKQKVDQSSYHLDSNRVSHLVQDPDEHSLLRYATPVDKHSSDPYAAEEHDVTEKFKAAELRKLACKRNAMKLYPGAARTPVGSLNGSLSSLSAHQLGSTAITAALERAKVLPEKVSEVLVGQILTAAQGQNPARQAAMLSGIPKEVPSTSINMLCGSGLRTVAMGYQSILVGDADVVVAAGQESMSQ